MTSKRAGLILLEARFPLKSSIVPLSGNASLAPSLFPYRTTSPSKLKWSRLSAARLQPCTSLPRGTNLHLISSPLMLQPGSISPPPSRPLPPWLLAPLSPPHIPHHHLPSMLPYRLASGKWSERLTTRTASTSRFGQPRRAGWYSRVEGAEAGIVVLVRGWRRRWRCSRRR